MVGGTALFFGVLLVLVEFLGVWAVPVDAVQTLGKAFIVPAALAGDCSILQKEENVSAVAAIHQSLATIQKVSSENGVFLL